MKEPIKQKRITVFLSSSEELSPLFMSEAHRFGSAVAQEGWDLVYGGTNQGAMGQLASGFLKQKTSSQLVGVLPKFYTREWAHPELDSLLEVKDLPERKQRLIEEGDVMIALPGGIGTLDEVTDFLAALQLQLTTKSMVFFNYLSYWEPFLECLRVFEEQSTVPVGFYKKLQVLDSLEAVIEYVKTLK